VVDEDVGRRDVTVDDVAAVGVGQAGERAMDEGERVDVGVLQPGQGGGFAAGCFCGVGTSELLERHVAFEPRIESLPDRGVRGAHNEPDAFVVTKHRQPPHKTVDANSISKLIGTAPIPTTSAESSAIGPEALCPGCCCSPRPRREVVFKIVVIAQGERDTCVYRRKRYAWLAGAGDPVQLSPVRTTNRGQGFHGFWCPTA
jgi:hypothetical protein